MKFSLLYKNPPQETFEENKNPFDVVYDLSIDKAVSQICRDSRRVEYFLSVMKKPLEDRNEIIYRQHLLADFIEFPELFDEFKVIFSRYDKIKSDWIELRSGIFPSGAGANSEALLDYTFSSLKVTSIFPRTIISFYESIYRAICKYQVKSEALTSMREYCLSMTENNSLNEIADIASLFQYKTPEDYDFGILCHLDETLLLCECELCDIKEHKKQKKPVIDLKKFIPKKQQDNGEAPTEVGTERDAIDNARFILTEALYHIDTILTQITNSVYDTFHGLSSELMFYEIALKCCEFLSDRNVPICMPEVLPCESDTIKAKGLRDFYLAAGGKLNGDEIIPNDVDYGPDAEGVLIRGMNNTGKTTYLRSIGIGQVFAQCGLPVCAESAVFSIRSAVFTHFSSAEEDFIEGDTSGRFEGEVKEMAKMVDNLRPYALIILNETFQTTAYNEGAVGIYNIISVFHKVKTKFIFVTHLLRLFDMCDNDKIKLMETVQNGDSTKQPYIITPIGGNTEK